MQLASVMALPQFIFLKSNHNNKYLSYTKEEGPRHARLRFSLDDKDEKAEIQYFKFELEEAKVEGMVHIRNCYNNKYFVRQSADSNLIVGEANEPEEDESKWTCTLFKPIFVDSVDEDVCVPHDEPRKIRLLHVDQLRQQYLCMSDVQEGEDAFDLVVGNQDARSSSENDYVFTVFDAGTAVILPKNIAIMGHTDQYCAVTSKNNYHYLEFKTTDIGASGVLNEAYNFPAQQMVSISNVVMAKGWIQSGTFIILDTTSVNFSGYYRATRLGGNEIALLAFGNQRFVNCGSGSGMQHALGASATSITEFARFRVVEAVLLREVSDVVYNISDARIYNVGEVSIYSDSRANYSPVEQTGSFSVSYTKTQATRWSDSVSITTGVSGSMSVGIPFVGDFGIEVSREETQTREWGEETTKEETVEYVQNLTIPSMTRLTLKVVAMRASCDVPFSCNVSDTLSDGRMFTYRKTDGLFVGSNGYNYETKILSEKL